MTRNTLVALAIALLTPIVHASSQTCGEYVQALSAIVNFENGNSRIALAGDCSDDLNPQIEITGNLPVGFYFTNPVCVPADAQSAAVIFRYIEFLNLISSEYTLFTIQADQYASTCLNGGTRAHVLVKVVKELRL